MILEEITCELKDIAEYSENQRGDVKKGRYHGSMFWDVKGFGSRRWVVGAYLDVDYASYMKYGMGKDEIIQACLNHLNRAPPRKKFQKTTKKPLYGDLEVYRGTLKVDDRGKPFIEVLLITNQRKNKNFWSEGIKL